MRWRDRVSYEHAQRIRIWEPLSPHLQPASLPPRQDRGNHARPPRSVTVKSNTGTYSPLSDKATSNALPTANKDGTASPRRSGKATHLHLEWRQNRKRTASRRFFTHISTSSLQQIIGHSSLKHCVFVNYCLHYSALLPCYSVHQAIYKLQISSHISLLFSCLG